MEPTTPTETHPKRPGIGGRRISPDVTKPLLKDACDLLGGVAELSRKVVVSPSYISKVLHQDIPISQFVANKIEELTNGKIKAIELRPPGAKTNNQGHQKGERIRDRRTNDEISTSEI